MQKYTNGNDNRNGNGNVNQWLLSGDVPKDPFYNSTVTIRKVDSVTGNTIAGDAEFTIYEWNKAYGQYMPSKYFFTRQDDVYYSGELFYYERNEGKFLIEETKAPYGYYGDYQNGQKRQYPIVIPEKEGKEIEITIPGTFPNIAVTGKITLYKIDTESQSKASQGDATLDGAIYDIYAAADILEPDTEAVKYAEGTKVGSMTIKDGIATYSNLPLGNYEIIERIKETTSDGKKLSYAAGYLVDEEIHSVTLSYEGEQTAQVIRKVTSCEQIIKAKAVFDKCESATGQGNINYLEGAGFTVYQLSKLSKYAEFTYLADGSLDMEKLLELYEVKGYSNEVPKYDFSKEKAAIATVNVDSSATFYYDDAQKDIAAGKLVLAEGTLYRVAELFSDKNGRVITPYLAFGDYLIVETTVPTDHFMCKPFLLTLYDERSTDVVLAPITKECLIQPSHSEVK